MTPGCQGLISSLKRPTIVKLIKLLKRNLSGIPAEFLEILETKYGFEI